MCPSWEALNERYTIEFYPMCPADPGATTLDESQTSVNTTKFSTVWLLRHWQSCRENRNWFLGLFFEYVKNTFFLPDADAAKVLPIETFGAGSTASEIDPCRHHCQHYSLHL